MNTIGIPYSKDGQMRKSSQNVSALRSFPHHSPEGITHVGDELAALLLNASSDGQRVDEVIGRVIVGRTGPLHPAAEKS